MFGFRKSGNGTRKDFTLTTAGEMALLYKERPDLFPSDCPDPYAYVNGAAQSFPAWINENPEKVVEIITKKIKG